MRDLRLFGTEAYPIHPSGMRVMVVCPWRAAMEYLFSPEESDQQAANTGSAMHVAAAEMHRGKEAAECVSAMMEGIRKYPRADLHDAAALFLQYSLDPRNRDARLILVEEPIAFQISPAPDDPTGAPIQVIGTLDQVREEDGIFRLYDIKTSKREPMDVLHDSTYQFAAYCIGASIKLGKPVHPGALILPRRYRSSDPGGSPVFWRYPWRFEHIEQILYGVRTTVARIRSGQLYHVPSDSCKWCHAKTPDNCLPKLLEIGNVIRSA